MKNINEFVEITSFEKRITASTAVMEKHNDKVPVIILLPKGEKRNNKSFIKYLVSKDLSIQYLMQLLRKSINLESREAIFLLTENGTLMLGNSTVEEIYIKHKSEDLYLYLHLKKENTFGI